MARERVKIAHLALVSLPDQSSRAVAVFRAIDLHAHQAVAAERQRQRRGGLRIPARRADVVAVAVELDVSCEPYPFRAFGLRGDDRRCIETRHHAQAHFRRERELRERHGQLAAVGGQAHLAWHFELGRERGLHLERCFRLGLVCHLAQPLGGRDGCANR